MVSGAVFCPHPPALVPAVAQGAAAELDDLRAAARVAIQRVATPGAEIIVIGAGPGPRMHDPTARGSLAGYGVELEIPLGADEPGLLELPLSLTIGAWLLRDALGPGHGAMGLAVGMDGALTVRQLGHRPDAPQVLIVMGDGSARRSPTAPGYLDERAAPFDVAVAAALSAGDPGRLRFDSGLGTELLAAGPPAWSAAAVLLAGGRYDAELLYDAAPYGVGYFVAVWTARD